MRIAIVHDTLTEFGGGERVVQALLDMYPQAHVYTAFTDHAVVWKFFPELSADRLHTSWVQHTKLTSRGYLFQFLSSFIWKSFTLEQYDVVISSSAFFLSNTIRVTRPVHIQYIHCPPKNIFGLSVQTPIQKIIRYSSLVAKQYRLAIKSSPHVLVNSKHIQEELRRLFQVPSTVIYPPVYIPQTFERDKLQRYYLIVSRIDESKKIELAIQACNYLQLPLKIVGKSNDDRYERYLRSIAGPTIEFMGFCDDWAIRNLYKNSIAFLFTPPCEDFGIAPVEAMGYGVPVIAYYGGGVKETVIQGKTGMFFYQHTAQALIRTLHKFQSKKFNPSLIHQYVKKFNQRKFKKKIEAYVERAVSNHNRHQSKRK